VTVIIYFGVSAIFSCSQVSINSSHDVAADSQQ
jgi:hypothetical protein